MSSLDPQARRRALRDLNEHLRLNFLHPADPNTYEVVRAHRDFAHLHGRTLRALLAQLAAKPLPPVPAPPQRLGQCRHCYRADDDPGHTQHPFLPVVLCDQAKTKKAAWFTQPL